MSADGGAVAATVGGLLGATARCLADAGIAEPRREARLILGLALGLEPAAVLGWPERAVAAEAARAAEMLAARRAQGEPFSRLKGRREFWSLELALSPETLDPRPESETLVAAALADIPDRSEKLQIIDFGTGTGCLLLALLSELPAARGLGIDAAPGAIVTAQRNAARHGFGERAVFRVQSWNSEIDESADVILANPPYIPSGEVGRLPREVLNFDPRAALDGGIDGLSAYRGLSKAIRRALKPRGRAYVEVGAGQAQQVGRIFAKSQLAIARTEQDLAGIERCLIATL